jgi:hypothetical protein
MVLSEAESKARRQAGMDAMTEAKRIRRNLTGGRPPAGELTTPLAAVTAARVLRRELETRMEAAGLEPAPGDCAVSIGYVSPDLSVIGFSPLFAPGEEARLMKMLDGNIMLGLVFGMVDKEAKGEERVILGTRPFLVTKQTEAWLSELVPIVRVEMLDPD